MFQVKVGVKVTGFTAVINSILSNIQRTWVHGSSQGWGQGMGNWLHGCDKLLLVDVIGTLLHLKVGHRLHAFGPVRVA